jgi:hypothetical protein
VGGVVGRKKREVKKRDGRIEEELKVWRQKERGEKK